METKSESKFTTISVYKEDRDFLSSKMKHGEVVRDKLKEILEPLKS